MNIPDKVDYILCIQRWLYRVRQNARPGAAGKAQFSNPLIHQIRAEVEEVEKTHSKMAHSGVIVNPVITIVG